MSDFETDFENSENDYLEVIPYQYAPVLQAGTAKYTVESLSSEGGRGDSNEEVQNEPTSLMILSFFVNQGKDFVWKDPDAEIMAEVWSNSSTVKYDTLIQNITMILENLLKNYDQNERPGGVGEPTVIYTNVFIRSMGPFSDLKMQSLLCASSVVQARRVGRRRDTDEKRKIELEEEPPSYLTAIQLTIKAKCPMELQNFPMDLQSCPLIFGSSDFFQTKEEDINVTFYISDAYTTDQIIYEWDPNVTQVDFQKGMRFTQFGIIDSPFRNTTLRDSRGREYSILQVNFNIQRYTGYFLIQIYLPCMLLVVLSWVSFWINREATADRVGLGITTVLTMSTITLDSRNDLPKVHYATAMDWFVVMSFLFVIATLLEFAGVHYFTKIGSGETYEGDLQDISDGEDEALINNHHNHDTNIEMNNIPAEQLYFTCNVNMLTAWCAVKCFTVRWFFVSLSGQHCDTKRNYKFATLKEENSLTLLVVVSQVTMQDTK
ncbi:Gamma-aminobutyric acid receptor subunit alpha-6 [Nymphon striatum]|nr:Gamma-aminobutyric acid receptor subunit alpha-6 [Nymphon striatum]